MSVGLGTSMGKGTGGDQNEDSDGEEKVEGDKRELENVVDGIAKRRKDGDVVGERKMKLKVDAVSDSMFEAGVLDDEKYVSLEERAVTLEVRYRSVEGDWRAGDVCMGRVCWSRPNVVFMMNNLYVMGWVCCLYCLSVIGSVPVFQIPK